MNKVEIFSNRFCNLCNIYATAETVCVGGKGNSHNPDVVILGEAPGSEEDIAGIPFVGRAGKLLDTVLGTVSIPSEKIYISNVVKCVPWKNGKGSQVRPPTDDEIDSCRSYWINEVITLDPKVIITLGNTPLKALTGSTGITGRRGKPVKVIVSDVFSGKEYILIPTYHPSYILRGNYDKQKDMESDIRLAMEMAGLEVGEYIPQAYSDKLPTLF